MMDLGSLNARIRDRISIEWLTPSENAVWNSLMRFDGPPHRVINVFGPEGAGKTFLGWLLEREKLATYCTWQQKTRPIHPRMILDNSKTERSEVRSIRPLVDKYGLQQIILLSRRRVDEDAMPAFELHVTEEDIEYFAANMYRHLNITIETANCPNYHTALMSLK